MSDPVTTRKATRWARVDSANAIGAGWSITVGTKCNADETRG